MSSDPESPVTPNVTHVGHLQMPISIRSLSLAIIALLAGLFVLHWARAVFIPFMLGLVMGHLGFAAWVANFDDCQSGV